METSLIFTMPSGSVEIKPLDDQKLFDLARELGIRSQDFIIVLEELLINCQEHGDGIASMQYAVADDLFIFRLSDRGSGIHRSIPRNPRLSDTLGKASSSILRLALEEGITGTGQIGRGMGLSLLSQFVRRSSTEAIIASDHGCVTQQGDRFSECILQKDVLGTVVLLKVARSDVGA